MLTTELRFGVHHGQSCPNTEITMKKTIQVKPLLDWINTNLASGRHDIETLKTYCVMAEVILFETDNYAGFGYVNEVSHDANERAYYERVYYYSTTMARSNAKFRSHCL